MKKMFLFFCCLGFVSLSLSAGGRRAAPVEPGPLRVGIMLAAESLPLMLARDNGYFEREGVNVELVLFSNPQERDAALQAGHLDATITDLLAATFFVAAGFDFRVTSSTDGRFGFVASPQSGITQLDELRGRRLGISLNSIIQYVLDSKLEYVGISMTEYEAVSIPSVPQRVEMVLEGLVDAVGLPEPILTAAVASGATLLSTTDDLGIDATVLFFSQSVLNTRLAEVHAFYRAYYLAAQSINAAPDNFRDYLVEAAGFPAGVRDNFRFVTYRRPALPEVYQIERALGWLRARELLTANLSPADLVDARATTGW
ncbi:MAG: ABC transporter substrate-binding protein [Spirochaetes bacterium]|nr:ABC transporter substrate-binding protein [Spirochaetota bacterium]